MTRPRRGPAGTPVTDRLNALTRGGALIADPLQLKAAAALDRVAVELAEENGSRGFLAGLFGGAEPVRGVYLVGQVGRGKTMLMDLFFEVVPIAGKRRVHFHEFMDEMHQAITAFRRSERGKSDNADPVAAVVKPLLEDVRLLCLDEFQVQDITNAMLLGRLFDRLFAGGVTIVATSNTRPDNLYENGLNRQLVLPFIAELKKHAEIVELDGPTDYRRGKFEGEAVYQFGVGPEVDAAMDRLWLKLTGGVVGEPAELLSLGRVIPVPHAAMGAARFSFAELCEAPLGARDYVKLGHAYETVIIDHVPQFDRLRTDASKRFIVLIDTLYDRGVKLAASFAVPLDELGKDERTRAEFARCVSRLIEMQSAEYLEAAHRVDGAA
ncbi:MAG: ATPase component BioM of energizing module of biotin transporter [Devosia sp.]|uniref:cell division protein ZapE n=1 Tax=Devosia sp. TaxID=1871048 RepID=UPI00262E9211|nr:cell division protein ZapE [Devosia sp.]MDB5540735.1 ATPase component BioM of energizing module of biotin transporter [Devosia sp.]